jgi:hypothetical protein
MARGSADTPQDVSNERAEQWLRTLGYTPEPEPAWIGEGAKPDFFGHGEHPFWVEVKTPAPPRHHEVMGRAWNDLRARCDRVEEVTGDLYAVIGDDYDEGAARWLIATLEREAPTRRRIDVVTIPADPIYEVTVRFAYDSEDGRVEQICAKSRSGRYPAYPALEPADWAAEIVIAYPDGSQTCAAAHRVLETCSSARLAARVFPSARRLELRGTLGADAHQNRSVWRVRQSVGDANRQIRNGQRFRPAPGVCAIYHDGLDALGEQQVLAALFGDLTIPIDRDPIRQGPAFLGRNGVLSPNKNRGISAVRYQRAADNVTVVMNPWTDIPLDIALFQQPVWVLDGDQLVLRD